MNRPPCLLVACLRDPANAAALTGDSWTLLLQQSRAAGMLSRLADSLLHAGGSDCPPGMRGHLESAQRVARAQRAEILREARYIDHALADLGAPVVLLKGAAYVLGGLPPAQGRVFSDVDILVPKSHIGQAESLLTMNGWMGTEQSEYNQHYYRQWMHELPPMQHVHRGTVLDVHHTILPETARLRPNPAKLLANARPLAGTRVLHVLAPADMLLHSMTHLFTNDDVSHALRDLSDLDLLLRHFSQEPGLWDALLPRAVELDLTRPLYYAIRHVQRVWATPVPAGLVSALDAYQPAAPLAHWMDRIWHHALASPPVGELSSTRYSLALQALYLRGHWMRMPPLLLARHLSVKALGLHKLKQPQAQPPQAG
jgi:Uncharacterised nucleotidyltransferase